MSCEYRSALSPNDLKWIASRSIDLKLILEQISRYADLAGRHHGERKYIELFRERVELGSKTAQALYDRATSIFQKQATAQKGQNAGAGQRQVRPTGPAMSAGDRLTNRAKITDAPIPADIEAKNVNGNRELILLVEDETEVADLASEILAMEGYKVIVAHNGVEALKIYGRIGRQIALVILDFFMPIMDGDAVFEELRALNPDIAAVLSSGFAEQNKISSMLADGLRGFIPKPYTGERLLAQVRSTLDAAQEVMA